MTTAAPRSVDELEERLSRPTELVIETLRGLPGDIVILGAGGKMGPSLSAMAQRAANAAGTRRRVIAVSRFQSDAAPSRLSGSGVEIVRADLAEPDAWRPLPDAALVVYMVGQKFGTQGAPARTWHMNTIVPAFAADRYRAARFAVFSTGNVYPLSAVDRGGSQESDAPGPIGEYAMSCLGRERVFEHAAASHGTRSAILRLNYAVDLRYGVLVDIAQRILGGHAVDVTMGHVNCIWQGDANAFALASLGAASAPVTVLNLTGPEILRVRDVAEQLAARLGARATIRGQEARDALLSSTARLRARWGAPSISAETLIAWVADWLAAGGETSGKATRFEQREGAF
ncbi:MAG: NAD(P)-dependent oxidoreductase [Gemmatimonadaceae bacterium]|nr:NAD(P)-dependent oxidoreductase [Gemmatimonadaceae bacterium]